MGKSGITESGANPKSIKANVLALWAQANAMWQQRQSINRQRVTEDFKIAKEYLRQPGHGRNERGMRPPGYRQRYSPKMNLTPGYKSIGTGQHRRVRD